MGSSRTLSLRNLVSGYERERVFPAGIGSGSPSRDAANWLSADRLRRRGGMVGGGWYSQARASSELQFGALREVAARERQEAMSRRAWERSIGWPRTRFGEGGGQLDRPRAGGVLHPCARESKARTGRFLREKMISDHGRFSSYEGRQGAANGQDSWGFFRNTQGFGWLVADSRAGFIRSRPPPPWTWVFQISFFLYNIWP